MIRVKFFNSGEMLTGFESKGHSEAGEYGKDIVCAFVSSACYMAANTVTEIIGINADAVAEEGYMRLSIKENPEKAQDILNGLKLHLTELEKDYPENISITIMEE